MNDEVTLSHLLKIEADADSLIDDAQAEADRRVTEGEKKNRAAYDQEYQKGAAVEEAEFRQEIDAVRENCQKELAAYRQMLNAIKADNAGFSGLLDSLFFGEE